MIFSDFKHLLPSQKCEEKRLRIFDNQKPFYSTIKTWYGEFHLGREPRSDKICEARPATAVTDENIDAVWHNSKGKLLDLQLHLGILGHWQL